MEKIFWIKTAFTFSFILEETAYDLKMLDDWKMSGREPKQYDEKS